MLRVGGADMVDGSPVYDVKPYLPASDSHPGPEDLMRQFMWPLLAVGFLSILLPVGIRLYKSRTARA